MKSCRKRPFKKPILTDWEICELVDSKEKSVREIASELNLTESAIYKKCTAVRRREITGEHRPMANNDLWRLRVRISKLAGLWEPGGVVCGEVLLRSEIFPRLSKDRRSKLLSKIGLEFPHPAKELATEPEREKAKKWREEAFPKLCLEKKIARECALFGAVEDVPPAAYQTPIQSDRSWSRKKREAFQNVRVIYASNLRGRTFLAFFRGPYTADVLREFVDKLDSRLGSEKPERHLLFLPRKSTAESPFRDDPIPPISIEELQESYRQGDRGKLFRRRKDLIILPFPTLALPEVVPAIPKRDWKLRREGATNLGESHTFARRNGKVRRG